MTKQFTTKELSLCPNCNCMTKKVCGKCYKAQILKEFLADFKKMLHDNADDTVWLSKKGAGTTILDAVEILIQLSMRKKED